MSDPYSSNLSGSLDGITISETKPLSGSPALDIGEAPTLPRMPAFLPNDVTTIETMPIATPNAAELAETLRLPARAKRQADQSKDARSAWRFGSTVVAVAIFLIVNVMVQFNRRNLDVLGDTFGGLARVQRCESLGRTPDVLYLGSSRSVLGSNPFVADQAVKQSFNQNELSCNASAFNSTFAQDYYTLKRVIEDGAAPKMIVESLWEFNLNLHGYQYSGAHNVSDADIEDLPTHVILSMADSTDAPLPTYQYASLNKHFSSKLYQIAQNASFLANKFIPIWGARIGVFKWLCAGTSIGPCTAQFSGIDQVSAQAYDAADARGWVRENSEKFVAKVQKYRNDPMDAYRFYLTGQLYHFQIGGHQLEWLDKLIALAQAHHIKVALVNLPLHAYFRQHLTTQQWHQVLGTWQATAQKYHVPYYDLSASPDYSTIDFTDPAHMSHEGAIQYSAWLGANVIGPILYGGTGS